MWLIGDRGNRGINAVVILYTPNIPMSGIEKPLKHMEICDMPVEACQPYG
jgi:hypothetical protein